MSVANANALMLRELVIHHPGYLPIKSASALILRELVLHLWLIPNSSGRRRSSLRVGDLSSEHITRMQRMLVLLPLRELVLCLLFTIMLSSNHNIVRVLSTSLFAMLTGGGLGSRILEAFTDRAFAPSMQLTALLIIGFASSVVLILCASIRLRSVQLATRLA